MLSFLTQGIGIGFAAGAQPGPFLNHVIGTALTGGWRRGIVTIFAPLVADLPLILLSVTVLRSVSPDFLRIVQLAGGLYLLWMAYRWPLSVMDGLQRLPAFSTRGWL